MTRNFPVLIVGAARSGTTLVHSLLLASGEFPMYKEGETHILQCESVYGPLSAKRNRERFFADFRRSKQFRRSELDPDAFFAHADREADSYVGFFKLFMDAMCRKQSCERWVEKTPANVFHMEQLAEHFPEARFLHVIRDGRDVSASQRKLGWQGSNTADPVRRLIVAARSWDRSVRTARRHGRELGDRYLEMRYEDLVNQPAETLGRLSAFAGVDLTPETVRESSVGALRSGFSAFGVSMEGISKRGLQRWKRDFSEAEILAVESAVGETLADLGYELSAGRRSKRYALYAAWSGWMLGLRYGLKANTPLGRFATPDLEFPD